MSIDFLKTDFGFFLIRANEDYLLSLEFSLFLPLQNKDPNIITNETTKQLEAYLRGTLKNFTLPTKIEQSPFSIKVLENLQKIEYGEVSTYKELAHQAGSPKAFRAVGSIMRKNPYPIIYPCHRIITSSGGLGGYALGLGVKEKLLFLEKKYR